MNRAQRRRQARETRLFTPSGVLTSQAIAEGIGVPDDKVVESFAKLAGRGLFKAEQDGTYSLVENHSQVRERLLAWAAMSDEGHWPDHEVKALLEWLKEGGRHRWPQLRTAADFQEHYDEVLADYQQRNGGQAP